MPNFSNRLIINSGILALLSFGCNVPLDVENNGLHHYQNEEISELEILLIENPNIADSLYWNGSYSTWPDDRKQQLRKVVEDSLHGFDLDWDEIPKNQRELTDEEQPTTVFSEADAWNLYITTIARMLALELSRELPWTLLSLNDDSLANLFDSRTFFRVVDDGYLLLQYSTPASPKDTMKFLEEEDLLGQNRYETILRLLKWSHENHSHFSGKYETKNVESYWGYRGAPPAEKIISGTKDKYSRFSHWTAGCHGTAAFFRSILRVVNIPVGLNLQCGHALPYFMSEGLYLSHADDPYSGLWTEGEAIPVESLIITKDSHYQWFGEHNDDETICNNVGRQTCALAKGRISEVVIKAYCRDTIRGDDDFNNLVMLLKRCADPDELRSKMFLEKIEEKVEARGGCGVH